MSFITKITNMAINAVQRFDSSFYNPYTGQGTSSDKSTGWTPGTLTPLDVIELADMYDGVWTVGVIVDEIVNTAFRKGILLTSGEESSVMEIEEPLVRDHMNSLKIIKELIRAIKYGRQYGGALMLLGTDRSQDLEQPLDIETVTSLNHVTVFDRKELVIESAYKDPNEPNYGDPEFYRIAATESVYNAVAHESHFLKFGGAQTSRQRKSENDGWDLSVIQKPYEEIVGLQSNNQIVRNMLSDSSQAILKVDNFMSMLASNFRENFLTRMRLLDFGRSSNRIMPIATDEEFAYVERDLANIVDILKNDYLLVSAAARIPVTVFMGQSPAGMDATGESDLEIWYGQVDSERTREYIEPLDVLTKLCAVSVGASNPDAWGGKFLPIEEESAKEASDRHKTIGETDDIYMNAQVVAPEEVREHRYGGEEYNDTPLSVEGEMPVPPPLDVPFGGEEEDTDTE